MKYLFLVSAVADVALSWWVHREHENGPSVSFVQAPLFNPLLHRLPCTPLTSPQPCCLVDCKSDTPYIGIYLKNGHVDRVYRGRYSANPPRNTRRVFLVGTSDYVSSNILATDTYST